MPIPSHTEISRLWGRLSDLDSVPLGSTVVWRALVLLAAIFCSGVALGQLAPSSANGETATFPIDSRPGLLFLPVTVGSATRFFALDSGASIHVLDESYCSESDAPMESGRVVTNGPPLSVPLRERPEMFVGTIRVIDDLPVAVHDFTDISKSCGRPVHGIIGSPFFHNRMICIDFDANSVSIRPCDVETNETWDHVIPLRIKNGVFFIDQASVQGDQLSLMLDTGMAGGIALSKKEFDRAFERDSIEPLADSGTTTVRGNISRRTGWLREFQIGALKAETVYVVEAEENKVGLGYLRKKRFRTLIDGMRLRLYLEPIRKPIAVEKKVSPLGR